MYKITFLNKSLSTVDTYVDQDTEYGAKHAVSERKDFDIHVSSERLSDQHADLIRDGWIPTGNWKWSKEVSDHNVVLRVSTESAQSENKKWEVFAEDSDGSVFDTPFETTSLSDAVIEATRMVQELASPDVETLIAASLQHGLDSEPDHEAGDLQDYFRAGWGILSSSQRTELLLHSRLKTALETATGKELHKIKKLLVDDDDKKIVAIFAIFQEHGNDEGAEAEISDLQDSLRSCWDVLTLAQRTELLELDSVQEIFENATMEPLFPEVGQPGDSETPGSRI